MSRVVVTSSGLNLREIPSTAGHIVDQLNTGDELVIIGERTSISGTKWLRVHVLRNGDQGWVNASHTKEKPDDSPKPDDNWSIPAPPNWDIPDVPSPHPSAATGKWEWVWVVCAVLIVVGLVVLFRH